MARKKLKWQSVENSRYTSSFKNFVFILNKQDIGVYSGGSAYVLKIRLKDEIKPVAICSFWTVSDGGYDTYQKKSVDKRLWKDIKVIQMKAEEILINDFYIE